MGNNNKFKNILEIINLPSGAISFIGGQFRYLNDNGYEMHLICTENDKILEFANDNDIKYYPVTLKRTLSLLHDIQAFLKIYNYIRRNKIDTIIAHQPKARLLGITAAFLARVPNRIIFSHGVFFETLKNPKRRVMIMMEKLIALLSHKTVCVSPSVAKVRLQYKIEKPSRQYFLGKGTCGGIDTQNKFNPDIINPDEQRLLKDSLGISDADFVVGFCGRLVRDKGIKELVEGFRLFKQNHQNDPHIKMMVIGKREIRDAISWSLNETIEKSKDIIHIESVDHRDISKYFAMFNVMVLPSYREGFGMVTIECGAMGVPAIVSRSTGCIDSIIEGETGLYCDITPESIANQLDYMYTNKDLRKEMGDRARSLIRREYDSSVIWPHMINVIEI